MHGSDQNMLVLVCPRPGAALETMRMSRFRRVHGVRHPPWTALDEEGRMWALEGAWLDAPRPLDQEGRRRFHEAFLMGVHLEEGDLTLEPDATAEAEVRSPRRSRY